MRAESRSSVASEDVVFGNAGVALSGTLYLPEGNVPAAAVVLVHGSARPDSLRMTALAQLLASDGFAVLTYDKRGIGESGGVFQDRDDAAAFTLLAEDAAAGLRVIGEHPRLKGVPTGLIGISQGGWVAPIAASKSPDTAFMVLWSGPVCTLSEELNFSAFAKKIRNFSMYASAADIRRRMRSVPHRTDDFDPRIVLSSLSLPSLWVFGGRDNSIPVELSVSRLERLIKDGRSNFEYRVFPEGGHGLDYPGSAPEAYHFMVAWIRSVAATAARRVGNGGEKST
ncbi:alpha/beta fold hydrolase [Luteimonas sp. SX5]|uniref:Alpha/beta fold hydrolase n=2 Tax=Luteimonas galliterrae TaxID=2940486 RepID=A0ABT0MJQ8_9GAMM|nr:alpha/beta fold hydrolase [Luteimonas galliterrae]MCL1634913.1 alpha/beta fold hydrolase [Luteimonas galliterrae]